MTTRQNEVRRILQKLNGRAPDDAEVARMANIAEAAEIGPTDALFPVMVALDHYRILFENIPGSIKEASEFMLKQHANALRADAEKIAAEQKGQLEEAMKKLLFTSSQWLEKAMPKVLSTELEKAATLAVREPVNNAARRFEQATQVAEHATSKLREAERVNTTTWVVGLLAAAIISGLVGGGLAALVVKHRAPAELTKEQQQQMQWGSALQAAWAKLPAPAQKIIKEAANAKEAQ